MPGSVLIVRRALLETKYEIVEKLIEITKRGVKFINENRKLVAKIIVEELSNAYPLDVEPTLVEEASRMLSPSLMLESMKNLNYTSELDLDTINQYVEFLYKLGYIEKQNRCCASLPEELTFRAYPKI